MTPPDNTLRGLMGLDDQPAGLGGSALVLIDLQNTYRQGVLQLEGVEEAVTEAAGLLERARAAGVPVFHVMHDDGEGSLYDIRAEIGRISDEVAPAPGEQVIVKTYPSSFKDTPLDELLHATGRLDVVLAGFMTHMCVNSTARDAFNLGYRPTVVASATATRALPARGVPGGGTVPAATVQAATLAGLADLFALVVDDATQLPG